MLTHTMTNRLSLSFLFLFPSVPVWGCYIAPFFVSECGVVGQPTRVLVGFPPLSNATGWANWGEEDGPIEGFVARTDTSNGWELINDGDDNRLTLEHVYTKAGTYSLSFEIMAYRNDTIDENGRCIILNKPAENDEWLLTVTETGCRDKIVPKSSAQSSSVLLASTVVALLSATILLL